MKKRRLFAATALIAAVSLLPMQTVYATSLTNETIEQSEAAKEEAEQSKNALKSGLTDVKKMLAGLEDAKEDLSAYIEELDSDLQTINDNIAVLEDMIEKKLKAVEEARVVLAEAEETEKNQYESMKKRIRFMYEKGNDSYLKMLFEAGSFSDFLNRAGYIQKLSEYDRDQLMTYRETRRNVEEAKAKLEIEEYELLKSRSDLSIEQSSMETLISAKEEEINVFENDISNKEAAIKQYEAEIAAQDALIKELEATILAEKKRLLEANRKAIVYDGGKFAWPAPSYKRISDEYGWRTHPILGVKQFHNGVDMAAPSGSPILAAYDGEVVAADYSSSMGNYIMIDHGDGLYTIYMHASSLGVKKGQMVVRGEQIGLVGSTGRSTGPHLHFSVRENGEYVSPWNYLG